MLDERNLDDIVVLFYFEASGLTVKCNDTTFTDGNFFEAHYHSAN